MASSTNESSKPRERGIIVAVKSSSRSGFVRTERKREKIFFHFASLAPLKLRGDPRIGDEVDFILHNDGNRRVATDLMYLPDGTVKFEEIIEKKVEGIVERTLNKNQGNQQGGYFNRMKKELTGGIVRRLETTGGKKDEKSAPPSKGIKIFEFHGRDLAPNTRIYLGDLVTFDVFIEKSGRVGAKNIKIKPGHKARGVVHHLHGNKTWGVVRTPFMFPRCKENDFPFFLRGSDRENSQAYENNDLVEFNVVRNESEFEAIRVKKITKSPGRVSDYTISGTFYGKIASITMVPPKRKMKGVIVFKRYEVSNSGEVTKDSKGNDVTVNEEVSFSRDSIGDKNLTLLKGDTVRFKLGWDSRGTRMKIRVKNIKLVKESEEKFQGIIWDASPDRHYVFIMATDRVEQIYARLSEIKDSDKNPPKRGQEVEFQIKESLGKTFAVRVRQVPKGTVKFYKILDTVHKGIIVNDLISENRPTAATTNSNSNSLPVRDRNVRGDHSKAVKIGRLKMISEGQDEKASGKSKEYTYADDKVLGFGRKRVVLLKGDVVEFKFRVDTQTNRKKPIEIKLVTPVATRRKTGIVISKQMQPYHTRHYNGTMNNGSLGVTIIEASPIPENATAEIASKVLGEQESAGRIRYRFWSQGDKKLRINKGDMIEFDVVPQSSSSSSTYDERSHKGMIVRYKVLVKSSELKQKLKELEKLRPKLPPLKCNAVVTRLPNRKPNFRGSNQGNQNYYAKAWPVGTTEQPTEKEGEEDEEKKSTKKSPAGIPIIFTSTDFVRRSTFLAVDDKITVELDARKATIALKNLKNSSKQPRNRMAVPAQKIEMVPKTAVCIGPRRLMDSETREIYLCRDQAHLYKTPGTSEEKEKKEENDKSDVVDENSTDGNQVEAVDDKATDEKAGTAKDEEENKDDRSIKNSTPPPSDKGSVLLMSGDVVEISDLRKPSQRSVLRNTESKVQPHRMAVAVTIIEQAPRAIALNQGKRLKHLICLLVGGRRRATVSKIIFR
mmetsp:Transcript_12375/g.18464  ORF Transcript_12375/g.18464 Transcript_12375/m.18464 type:complete len:1004 (+) Transcript_12375:63-3074(+)